MERPTRGRRQVQMLLERQFALHMSLGSVHRYMSILKLNSLRKKRYISQKKEAQNSLRTFPNVLQQDFHASKRHNKWLTDITYLPCKDGLLYLSCIINLSDKSIIAYSFSNKNDLRLVFDTLHKAEPSMKAGAVLHSDRGSQYCSPIYHKYLSDHGLIEACPDRLRLMIIPRWNLSSPFSKMKNSSSTKNVPVHRRKP